MGAFVAVYNALSFRLVAAPYHLLSQVALAAVFLVYAIGSLSSRYAGLLADRIGRRAVLPAAIALAARGLALTNVSSLPLIIAGIAILTAGFFAGHSVASSWIGRCAHKSPAQASALYLLAYYIGSSIAGPGQRSRLDPRRVEHRHDLRRGTTGRCSAALTPPPHHPSTGHAGCARARARLDRAQSGAGAMSELTPDLPGGALLYRLPVTGGPIDQQPTTQRRGSR